MVNPGRLVIGGVDTHLALNVAAAVDHIGGLLGVAEFATTSSGHKELLAWLKGFGPLAKVGIEGTGSYGAGLARYLRRARTQVVEVDRPNRQSRRRTGKSDPAEPLQTSSAVSGPSQMSSGKCRTGVNISVGASWCTPPPQGPGTHLSSRPGAVSRRGCHRRYEPVSSAHYTWARSFSGGRFHGERRRPRMHMHRPHNGPPALPADQGLTVPWPGRSARGPPAPRLHTHVVDQDDKTY